MTCLLVCLFSTGSVHAQPQPTLILEFEDGFDGVGKSGPIDAKLEGKPELVDGKFGKAMKSGPSTGYLHFPTKDVVFKESGTVEMWVCPVDWDGTEEKFHAFFDARDDGALYLYKYYQGGLLMLTCPNIAGPYNSASAPIATWKPGQWHHIAGTWSPTRQCVYVDGKRIATGEPGLAKRLDGEFTIGDGPWHIERTSSSLIDRVRIYDHLLSDEHIAAHFAGDYDKVVPVNETTCALTYSIDPPQKLLTTTANILGADVGADEARVAFSLLKAGQVMTSRDPQPFIRSVATADFSLADLKPGDYEVSATITSGKTTLTQLKQLFGVPSTEWMGNKVGLEDKVLPPWTPLKVTGGTGKGQPPTNRNSPVTVSCLGRTYEFGATGLPTQIISKDQPMLIRPVALYVSVDGKACQWAPGQNKVKSSSATSAEVEGFAETNVPQGKVTLRTHTRIEYDGLMLIDVGLETLEGVKPDSVSLDISLRQDVALYRHRWSPQWAGYSGNIPAGEGVVDSDTFIPYAWLGDNDRGLFWFCETGQQWPNWSGKNAFETVREGNTVTLRLNLLAKDQALPANWKYQFGLQATPVKPIPKDWRKWRLTPAPRANIHILWPQPTKDSMKYYGYPEAADPATFAKRIDEFHTKGVNVVPYSCLSFFSGASPEWQWFGSKWGMGGGDAGSSDVAAYGAVFQMICPQAKNYSDFIIWKNKQFMDQFHLDGYYHDNSHPYSCAVEDTGCGWRDAGGAWHQTFPILGFRDLYRRLYATVKSAKPDAFLMAHMSGKVTIPFLGYEDSYLDGEHFRGRVKDSYMDLMSLDTFRAEFMGRQWGIMPYFLPEFDEENQKKVEPTRGLIGLLLLHDVAPWPIWCNKEVFDEAFEALDSFGYIDSDFIPYFDAVPPGTTEMKDVYVSVYKRADGRALAIVANLSKENRSGAVRLNSKRIGLPLDHVISWPDKGEVKRTGDEITLDVPMLGYRMVLVGKEK